MVAPAASAGARVSAIRICAISDMHGHFPKIPPCDLLIISGDIAPDFTFPTDPILAYRQVAWFNDVFAEWLTTLPCEHVVATAGNHDFGLFRLRHLVSSELRWHLLIDQQTELFGLMFWGSPWVPNLPGWAFNLAETQLERKWSHIPDETDILVLHGPPFGMGDKAWRQQFTPHDDSYEHVGSTTLMAAIDRVQPQLVTFGHIHEAKGEWRRGQSLLVNVSVLDNRYRLAHKPWSIRLDLPSPVAVA